MTINDGCRADKRKAREADPNSVTHETARAAAEQAYNHGGYHGSAAATEDAMRAFVNGALWAARMAGGAR